MKLGTNRLKYPQKAAVCTDSITNLGYEELTTRNIIFLPFSGEERGRGIKLISLSYPFFYENLIKKEYLKKEKKEREKY